MNVGIYPYRNCLFYIAGSDCQCLLSNFDSSKKIIYVYYKSEIVGSAILLFSKIYDYKLVTPLEFIDIDKKFTIYRNTKGNISIINAKNMGIKFLISKYYRDALDDQYYKIPYNIFITRSKNGEQYLDTINGLNNSMKEATYVNLSEVYIHV